MSIDISFYIAFFLKCLQKYSSNSMTFCFSTIKFYGVMRENEENITTLSTTDDKIYIKLSVFLNLHT